MQGIIGDQVSEQLLLPGLNDSQSALCYPFNVVRWFLSCAFWKYFATHPLWNSENISHQPMLNPVAAVLLRSVNMEFILPRNAAQHQLIFPALDRRVFSLSTPMIASFPLGLLRLCQVPSLQRLGFPYPL